MLESDYPIPGAEACRVRKSLWHLLVESKPENMTQSAQTKNPRRSKMKW